MRIFKNTWFDRFADKEGITDKELWDMVDQLEDDQADAKINFSLTDEQIRDRLRRRTLVEVLEGGHEIQKRDL